MSLDKRFGPSAASILIFARLAADLREPGSHFTGALAMRRGLIDHERLAIERTRGRIDQLRAVIDSRLANQSSLSPAAFARLNAGYFDDGLRYRWKQRAVCHVRKAFQGSRFPRE
ncbi:hypothetical protein ACNRBS_07890 [Ralstonia pseudosolanacearum]|uniref:Uncharacterized protein n=1 Tax=Ralstonia solanacearum TaxID=305 RepID=A0A0K1ZN63_RALSL|nr:MULTISPECIES: hypothetical protein [Ralstonia]AKZ27458.1 hypothetical protein ACH51_14705 [Ralstonia solanacearum]QWQ11480.1 hypothetical protein KN198_14695 [Ralstonia solanacearum]UZF14314.1 hypothetical protein LH706_15030 [Ralstonia solanacearum]UZF24415.1 hypothetical protein LGV80_15130 [Ralstonia sp. RS642]UZF29445.1 hypothetical protein LGV82_15030 [Ralstonia sp. RS650]